MQTPPPPPDWALVQRLTGREKPEDQATIAAWTDTDDGRARTVEALSRAWDVLSQSDSVRDVEWQQTSWKRIHDQVEIGLPQKPSHIRVKGRRRSATILALSATALGVALVVTSVARIPSSNNANVRVYTTHVAQRATVDLPNGARLTLAPRTNVRWDGMTADLDGEAYFEIPHATTAPFIVRTGNITTRVLGTTFGVRHYPGDTETRVAVLNGKVTVGAHRPITVTGGFVAHATDSSTTVSNEDAASYTSWTTGHLVFRDAPLADVLAAVSQWYGIRFRIADPALAQQHITATVDLDTQAELLRALTLVLDVTLSTDSTAKDLIILHPRRSVKPTTRDSFHSVQELGR